MIDGPMTSQDLVVLNTTMFYAANWIFIAANTLMLFKIRHINDKLKMRQEMGWIVTIYSVCTYF